MVAILSHQREAILRAVQAMYTDVASHPRKAFHFPTGRPACLFVGYPPEVLAPLPASAVESFAGVGYPFAAGGIAPGDAVLDIGSGSGTDLLIASALVGSSGRVIGLDLTPAMLRKLEHNLTRAGAANARPLQGNAEEIPLPDGSMDVVTSNGVLNLVPDKRRAMAEIFRVLRPGGRVQIADIVLGKPMSDACRSDPQLWAECVVGATREDEYLEMLRSAGFLEVEVLGRLDYFSASGSAETRSIAASFNAHSIVACAVKPPAGRRSRNRSPWPPRPAKVPAPAPAPVARPRADDVLDAHGQNCGTLDPLLRARMRRLASGQVLEVGTDDPSARLGVPAWTRLAGHELLLAVDEDERRTRFYLRRK